MLLDQRVRRAGSHHQKLVLIRHADAGRPDVAFVGGIDLCHGRRDDERHLGDVQPEEMDDRYGEHPPWHDIQVCIRGPAVGDLDHTFRERWEDPTPLEEHRTPLRVLVSRWSKQPELRDQLPDQPPDPAPEGSQAVQVLRTYPSKRPAFSVRPGRGAEHRPCLPACVRAGTILDLRRGPVPVVGRRGCALRGHVGAPARPEADDRRAPHPDRNGIFSGPPHRLAQLELVDRLTRFGRDRFQIFDLENEAGTPIYVHAKTIVVDDVWAAVGSDNLNRRSWTNDSELSCAILDEERDEREPRDPAGMGDGARSFARSLRLTLLREHLQLDDRRAD